MLGREAIAAVLIFRLILMMSNAVSRQVAGPVLFPVGPVTTCSGDILSLGAGIVRNAVGTEVISVSLLGLAANGILQSLGLQAPYIAVAAPPCAGRAAAGGV